MKQNLTLISIMLLALLGSCKKDIPIEPPGNGNPDPATNRVFSIVFDKPATQSNVLTDLTAYVTATNTKNEPVFTNKKVTISFEEKYRTANLTLPKGNYRLTGLLIRQGDTSVVFASPIAGSIKAALVQHPLSNVLNLDEKGTKEILVEVLPVGKTDTPESFGYPEGSFGNIPGEGPEQDKLIFIRPVIKIGDLVYDSIPVHLVVRSFDAQGNMDYRAMSLPAGLQPVHLSKNAVRYTLSVSKWGTQDEIAIEKKDVVEGSVHVIGGAKQAKLLKTVFESKLVNGVSTPLTKTEYQYHSDSELRQILTWGKRPDRTTYLQQRQEFDHVSGNITGVRFYNEHDALSASRRFDYNATNRVIAMEEKAGADETRATVSYTALETSSGITQDHQVDISYDYTHHYYKGHYTKTMRGGSVLVDRYSTSHGTKEETLYGFDFAINPYAHLRIPDLTLSQYARHNVNRQWKSYVHSFPLEEAYDFSYTYDGDGYPTQLITKYRSYLTKADVYSIRTVFVY
jgi:hypothetical protein